MVTCCIVGVEPLWLHRYIFFLRGEKLFVVDVLGGFHHFVLLFAGSGIIAHIAEQCRALLVRLRDKQFPGKRRGFFLEGGICKDLQGAAQHGKFWFRFRYGIVAEREVTHGAVDVAARFRVFKLVIVPDVSCRLTKKQPHFPVVFAGVRHPHDIVIIVQRHCTVIK